MSPTTVENDNESSQEQPQEQPDSDQQPPVLPAPELRRSSRHRPPPDFNFSWLVVILGGRTVVFVT